MLAFDFSEYSKNGPITIEEFQAIKAQGYELAIGQLWNGESSNPYALASFRHAQQVFEFTAGYIALAPSKPDVHQIQRAYETINRTIWQRLCFIAIDCELDGITEAELQAAISQVQALGQRAIIYSGYWWWHDHFGNPTNFSSLPLWTADYDTVADLSKWLPYGGWAKIVGKQYEDNSLIIPGVTIDNDTFDDAFIKG